jgi:hypothetical protein
VTDDLAARDLLARVADEWTAAGVLGVLCRLVGQIWRADLDRYEPEAMGDDLMSLGMQASRNLCNLAVRELHDLPGVQARDRNTLEIGYGGRVLHTGKAPSDAPDWNVQHLDWADSDVRERAAEANTAAYQSPAGTLFEDLEPLPGQRVNPEALKHLHLTWQGLADGSTRTWLGFPQLGLSPWYAVMAIDDSAAPSLVDLRRGAAPGASLQDFDLLGEPEVAITPRPRPARSARPAKPVQGA